MRICRCTGTSETKLDCRIDGDDSEMTKVSTTLNAVRALGKKEREFPISIGPRFLELFSENLYSSANKAFEELVANSWDAEATSVYISLPDDLKSPEASAWVLDNGTSMNADGLETLWQITSGHKRSLTNPTRPQIGKFGIGKLATYILASEITFICRSSDGQIRTVSCDYRDIDEQDGVWNPGDVPLAVRDISSAELEEILLTVDGGDKILDLISRGVPSHRIHLFCRRISSSRSTLYSALRYVDSGPFNFAA